RRLPIGVSLAWLTVVFSVPFFGAVAYLLFGGKRLDRRRYVREAAVLDDGERVVLLDDVDAVFTAFIKAIDRATESCCLAYYIWSDGGRADEIGAALVHARARGVHGESEPRRPELLQAGRWGRTMG